MTTLFLPGEEEEQQKWYTDGLLMITSTTASLPSALKESKNESVPSFIYVTSGKLDEPQTPNSSNVLESMEKGCSFSHALAAENAEKQYPIFWLTSITIHAGKTLKPIAIS